MDNQKIVELELANQQLSHIAKQLQLAEGQVEHAVLATSMLEELKEAKPDQELLVPIGNGIFITVKASEVHKVKMAVGANVVVDKSIEDALGSIQKQVTEAQQYHQQLSVQYEQIIAKANQLQEELDQDNQQ